MKGQPEKPLLFRKKTEELQRNLQNLEKGNRERGILYPCRPNLRKPPAAHAASRCGKWAVCSSKALQRYPTLHRDPENAKTIAICYLFVHFFNLSWRSFTTMWLEPQTSPARAQSITLRPLEVSFSTSTPSSKRISSTSCSPCIAAT